MSILIAVVSILAVSAAVWLINRILPFIVCPICAGVFLTWTGLIGAHFMGYRIDLIVPALLMGGSVVGIAYQLEKKFNSLSSDALLLRKALFIPAGFVAAYAVLEQLWTMFFFAAAFLSLISLAFSSSSRMSGSRRETVGGIERRMKDCC
jgi:hypothetical protein